MRTMNIRIRWLMLLALAGIAMLVGLTVDLDFSAHLAVWSVGVGLLVASMGLLHDATKLPPSQDD